MAKFKVGDRVRTNTKFRGAANVGATATVVGHQDEEGWIVVEWDACWNRNDQMNGRYYPSHFELVVAPATTAIRTVTRREIVPGVYGTVGVGQMLGDHLMLGFVGAMQKYVGLNADDLRAAAALFTELADVLDEQQKEAA